MQNAARMTGIEIVESEEAHAEGFNRVLVSLCAEGRFLAAVQPPPVESTRAFILKMQERGCPSFLALDGGKVVGWCDVSRGKGGEGGLFHHTGILGMGLLAEYRGRGIGKMLLEKALAAAQERGIMRVELLTLESNKRAIALYERYGFVFEGIKKHSHLIDGKYENGYMMALVRA